MATHLGIAAVSPEGAALCYRQIFRHAAEVLDDHDFPVVSVYNLPLARYVDAVRSDDWRTVGDLLRRSADALASIGAEVCLCPDNGVQHGIHLAQVGSAIPWLSMTDAVADAVIADRCATVGIIGTSTVTRGSIYQTQLGLRGIKVVAPTKDAADEMDAIIYNELIYGQVKESSRTKCGQMLGWFEDKGCQGVILGCSEAPLIVSPDKTSMCLYNTTNLLAHRAVHYAASAIAG